MNYRRTIVPGGTFFFTIVTYNRQCLFDSPSNISILRDAYRYVAERHPFELDAWVVLPDHIHTIWTLPEDDHDYPMRWRLLKSYFTRKLENKPAINLPNSRLRKGEQAVWQSRYWEHLIRDEVDFQRHVEYIHANPVKHGCVDAPDAWPYSSIHQYIKGN